MADDIVAILIVDVPKGKPVWYSVNGNVRPGEACVWDEDGNVVGIRPETGGSIPQIEIVGTVGLTKEN